MAEGTSAKAYVHGYCEREAQRLHDQASTLAALLHSDVFYPPDSRVLEAGCGTGAQTITLARSSPQAQFVSVDISADSLRQARARIEAAGLTNVTFEQGDIVRLPFEDESFDHLFLCFVLEHLPRPVEALAALRRLLRPGGTVTAIEGDHGSAYFHPDDAYAHRAIRCLVDLQAQAGGDALIGRRLYPLLKEAGFNRVEVRPRVVYVDSSRPELVEGFTKNTFTAMVEGVEAKVLEAGLMGREDWRRGIDALYRTAGADGTFNYTFFKATGTR